MTHSVRKPLHLLALLVALACAIALCACANQQKAQDDGGEIEKHVQELIDTMPMDQKVAQLFIVRPEGIVDASPVVRAGEATKEAIATYPVGGICYFADNIQDPDQTREMLDAANSYSMEAVGLPLFLCVDEEGGQVARVAENSNFGVGNVGDMREIGDTGDPEKAAEAAEAIAGYLKPLGFNVDFAPVCDIASSESQTMAQRSFGTTPETVTPMVKAQVEAFMSNGMLCSAKHFPGIGAAMGDSHDNAIYTDKALDEMAEEELLPFQGAIESGVPFVMLGHLNSKASDATDLPASLDARYYAYLHKEMGFEGIAITDSLEMGALGSYDEDETAKQAIIAGADMVLMPNDFEASYNNVLEAVKSGEIPEERINEALARVLRVKLTYLAE